MTMYIIVEVTYDAARQHVRQQKNLAVVDDKELAEQRAWDIARPKGQNVHGVDSVENMDYMAVDHIWIDEVDFVTAEPAQTDGGPDEAKEQDA